MKLALPLKYYDEAGRVKPPGALYLCGLFLCRSLIVLIGAETSQRYSSNIIHAVYLDMSFLYLHLGAALPCLIALLLIGFRDKLQKAKKRRFFYLIWPLFLISACADLSFNVYLASINKWQFSWLIACSLVISCLCLFYLIKDKHIKFMLIDWNKVE